MGRYRMWKMNSAGSLQEVDLEAEGVQLDTLTVSYDGPRTLNFRVHCPEHELPFSWQQFIIVADEEYQNGDHSTPIFEGWTTNPEPGDDAREVKYTAYDATHRAGEEIAVMSGPANSDNEVPRLVFNCKIEQDEDFAYQRFFDATIGEMIEVLLSDPWILLWPLYAAPHPSQFPGKPAYDAQDLTALDLKPQDKVVFDNVNLRTALTTLLGHYPQYRMLFHCGPFRRQWRIINVKNSPQRTLTLGDPDINHQEDHIVLSLDLSRTLDHRATAIKLYGPRAMEPSEVSQSAGTLLPLWTPAEQSAALAVGPNFASAMYANVGRRWQIKDEEKRRMALQMPEEILVPATEELGGNMAFARTTSPSLQATWDQGKTWYNVKGWRADRFEGIVTAPTQLFNRNAGTWELPDDVRLIYSYLDEPLTVRFPEQGYEGTAYAVAGIAVEKRITAEDLVVGWEFYHPVTSQERKDQFRKLAKQLLEVTKDIIYTGGMTLDGLDWDYIDLDRRVNFKTLVRDANGDPIQTGWESINAIVTEVQYDLNDAFTTVTFSNDWAEFTQQDPALLRELLRIKAMQTIRTRHFTLTPNAGGATQQFRDVFHHVETPAPPVTTYMELE